MRSSCCWCLMIFDERCRLSPATLSSNYSLRRSEKIVWSKKCSDRGNSIIRAEHTCAPDIIGTEQGFYLTNVLACFDFLKLEMMIKVWQTTNICLKNTLIFNTCLQLSLVASFVRMSIAVHMYKVGGRGEKYYPMTYLFWRHALKIVDCLTCITDYFQQAMACTVDI